MRNYDFFACIEGPDKSQTEQAKERQTNEQIARDEKGKHQFVISFYFECSMPMKPFFLMPCLAQCPTISNTYKLIGATFHIQKVKVIETFSPNTWPAFRIFSSLLAKEQEI